jgi:hypothetical protein
MALTAQELFRETVSALPPKERLRLAALILQDLAQSEGDTHSTWSDQDERDVSTASLRYAAELYPEDKELV